MKVALVYDRVNKWGGAERVMVALKRLFPEADLYTSVYHPNAFWAKDFSIKTSFLQRFPKASTSHEFYALLMPVAFESFTFDEYDLVISVTSEAAKGVITHPKTLHVCYCLTPTRYLWSGYNTYFKGQAIKILASPAISYLRMWDSAAASRPDYFIAISQTVKERIQKYYVRDADIIYPAVTRLADFPQLIEGGSYFLVVSRLVSYKRIDLAIKAANNLKLPLKIVGEGRDRKKLESIAGDTVEFLGTVSDQELSLLYANCRALIFPGIEDFGLVIVEAQQFGKPVITFRGGGATEIIQEGKTGAFFDKQTVKSLQTSLQEFQETRYNSEDCMKNSERFSFECFEKGFKKIIDEKMKEYFK